MTSSQFYHLGQGAQVINSPPPPQPPWRVSYRHVLPRRCVSHFPYLAEVLWGGVWAPPLGDGALGTPFHEVIARSYKKATLTTQSQTYMCATAENRLSLPKASLKRHGESFHRRFVGFSFPVYSQRYYRKDVSSKHLKTHQLFQISLAGAARSSDF